MKGKVMTVLGPIDPKELGVTLPHEHFLVDSSCLCYEPQEATKKELAGASVDITNLGAIRRDPYVSPDNMVQLEMEVALEEALAFKRFGGESVVDVTCIGIGRDPAALKSIANQTGLNIIMGCGYYVQPSHPPEVSQKSVQELADLIIEEITNGLKRSGVKPGIIGEIGIGLPMAPDEEKALRAAARASLCTGAAVTIHTLPRAGVGIQILDIVEEEGANPERVIICHMNGSIRDMEYNKALAARGAYIGYDNFGLELYWDPFGFRMPSDVDTIAAVKEMIDSGFRENILISQDVSMKVSRKRYGGWGMSHILENLPQYFSAAGITEEDLHAIMVENPAKALTFVEPAVSS